MLAVQQGGVYWMHQDPVAKSKRITDASGNVVSTIELDPWGGETNRSSNEAFQPRTFTTYVRDSIGSDEAMHRRYNRWWARFEQPDPYDGSYDPIDPQSFNRYSYAQNDPVNFVDPLGLDGIGALGGAAGGELGPIGPGTVTVTVSIGGSNSGLAIDSHAQLLLVNFLIFRQGAPQNPISPEELVKSGTGEAQRYRLKNAPCAKFFGGMEKGQKALNSLNFSIDPTMDSSGHPQARITGNNVSVNPNRGFPGGGGLVTPDGVGHPYLLVDPKNGNIAVVTLYGAAARAFGQLHETAHKGKRFGNTDNDLDKQHLMNGYRNNLRFGRRALVR